LILYSKKKRGGREGGRAGRTEGWRGGGREGGREGGYICDDFFMDELEHFEDAVNGEMNKERRRQLTGTIPSSPSSLPPSLPPSLPIVDMPRKKLLGQRVRAVGVLEVHRPFLLPQGAASD